MTTNRLFYLWIVTGFILIPACAPSLVPAFVVPALPTQPPILAAIQEPIPALVGTWTSAVTTEDLLRVIPDLPEQYLCGNAGIFVWSFQPDGMWAMDQTLLSDCASISPPHIQATWFMDGNLVAFEKGTLYEQIYEVSMEGNQLTFQVVSSSCPPCIAIFTANPWTRVE